MGAQLNADIGQKTLDFIESLDAVEDADGLTDGFGCLMGSFGFDFFLLTGLPEPGGCFEDEIILNAWPRDWFDHYISQNYIHSDPVAHEWAAKTQPFSWCEVPVDSRRWPLGRQIRDEATEHGMPKGFCVPIFGLHGFQSAVTLAGEDVDLSPQARASVHLASIYTHGRARHLLETERRNARLEHVTLSGRERECLTWAAAGKSSWEISQILRLTENTVTGYIKAAARKLGSVNRTQAVAEAIRTGKIRI